MNLVEHFFRLLTGQVVREGSFIIVTQLVEATNVHLFHHNPRPTPLRWKADGQAILAKLGRTSAALKNT